MYHLEFLRKQLTSILLTGLLFLLNMSVSAQVTDTVKLFDMSLEGLLNSEVTTVSKSSEKQSEAPGIISVVTKDELNRFGGTTLKDILERVPGLIISSSTTDRAMISIRGNQIKQNSSHVLLLINGRPVREILDGGISSDILSTFPVNIIDRIEVIKGPGSVLYGSDAFSGVINIITEKADKTGGSIQGAAGSNGFLQTAGDLKLKTGDLSIIAAGNYYNKGEWKTPYIYREANGQNVTSQISIPDKGPGAYLGINYKNFSFIYTFNKWENQFFMPNNYSTGKSTWTKTFGNLGYEADVIKSWHTSVNLTYTQSNLNIPVKPFFDKHSKEFVTEWTNFIDLNSKSKLVIGGLFNHISGFQDIKEVTASDTARNGLGLYAQIDYRLLHNLKFIGGLQLNKTQNVEMGFVPRVGLIWNPIEKINVKALYSEAFRAPSINELSINGASVVGDPNLLPEKMGTFDIGINYQAEMMQLDANYYKSKASNIISRKIRPGLKDIYANIDAVDFTGLEFAGKFYATKNLYLNASVIYQENTNDQGKDNVTPIANLGIKAGISYSFNSLFTLSLFDIYQGPISERYSKSINPAPGPYNLLHLHGNLSLNKLFKLTIKQEASLYVQTDNLLDEEVWLPTWGLANGLSMPYNSGRTVYAGIKFAF